MYAFGFESLQKFDSELVVTEGFDFAFQSAQPIGLLARDTKYMNTFYKHELQAWH